MHKGFHTLRSLLIRHIMIARGINLSETDNVVGVINYDASAEDAADHTVLVVSANGYGKRSNPEDYRLTNRGSKGVKTISITDKTGALVAIKNVTEANDLMIITQAGLTIRMAVSDIRVAGRATQGVRLININEGDSIAAVSVVAAASASEEENGTETANTETDTETTNE